MMHAHSHSCSCTLPSTTFILRGADVYTYFDCAEMRISLRELNDISAACGVLGEASVGNHCMHVQLHGADTSWIRLAHYGLKNLPDNEEDAENELWMFIKDGDSDDYELTSLPMGSVPTGAHRWLRGAGPLAPPTFMPPTNPFNRTIISCGPRCERQKISLYTMSRWAYIANRDNDRQCMPTRALQLAVASPVPNLLKYPNLRADFAVGVFYLLHLFECGHTIHMHRTPLMSVEVRVATSSSLKIFGNGSQCNPRRGSSER